MKYMALDWGEKRMGFAVSDPSGIIAMPLEVVEVSNEKESIKAVIVCADNEEVQKLIVGLPVNMDGTEGFMAERVRKFAEKLKLEIDIPVEMYDERLSTRLVDRVMLDANLSKDKRKGVRDKLAAQVILSGYLDSLGFNDSI